MKLSAISLPTADQVNMLARFVEKIEKRTDAITGAKSEEVTFRQQAVAKVVASIGAIILATVDTVANVGLVAVKIVPVLLNETFGRLTGLSQYVTSPALTRQDFVQHLENIRRDFVIAWNAVLVFTPLASADMIPAIARNLKLLPVVEQGEEGVEKQGETPVTPPQTVAAPLVLDQPVTEQNKAAQKK